MAVFFSSLELLCTPVGPALVVSGTLKSPTAESPAGFLISILAVFSSSQISPPAWVSHDDGGGRDGGGFASEVELMQAPLLLSNAQPQILLWITVKSSRIRHVIPHIRMTVAAIILIAGLVATWLLAVTPAKSANDLVDVNHASVQELLRVPGLSEVWARRIVRFRPYRSKLDLLNGGVLPQNLYARIRGSIIARRVSGSP